jgi:hypothetical protein
MARFHNRHGARVQFTPEEEIARDAEEKVWRDGAFDRALLSLRDKRNRLLAETDWWASTDLVINVPRKAYRQKLRDITAGLDTVDKVNAVTWPEKPE